MSYQDFIAAKTRRVQPRGPGLTGSLNPKLFRFQRAIVEWALMLGRAAVFADCGLGKTWIALEWARHIGGDCIILCPLAVAHQFREEGKLLDIDVTVARETGDLRPGINCINYDRLGRVVGRPWDAVVLDESSILKDYTSKTRNAIIGGFDHVSNKLACTATPAPNDVMELGNHAEFLGVMSRSEMLACYFVHDGGETQKWRLKGHAVAPFWRWVSGWAVAMSKPSDIGYDDTGYDLPGLRIHAHTVDARLDRQDGYLFAMEAVTLHEQRQAQRKSIPDRVNVVAGLVNGNDKPWVVWCNLNDESAALTAAIPDAVEVKGSDDNEKKEQRLMAFRQGEARVLVTKPSICGWGLNWQHCADVAFCGISNSFEQWYQAIRRCYRFGQRSEVSCHIVTSSQSGRVIANLERKREAAKAMVQNMTWKSGDLSNS